MAVSKLDQLIAHIRNSLDEYRSVNSLPSYADVILLFTGNDRLVRIHCGGIVGVPELGDFFFDGDNNKISRIVQVDPLGLTQITSYEMGFSTTLSALSTNFGSLQFEFLELKIQGPDQLPNRDPVMLTADVRYQNIKGPLTISNVEAEFSIVSGDDWAGITPDGLLVAKPTQVGGDVTVQARYITTQGNRFTQKTIKVLPNFDLVPDHIDIFGSGVIKGGESLGYIAAMIFTDGSSVTVNPRWSVDRSIATISSEGVLSVRNILNSSTSLNLHAEVSFQGVTYQADFPVTVVRTGNVALAARYGSGAHVTDNFQVLINSLIPAQERGTRLITFTAQSKVGERVWLAYPEDFGEAIWIKNENTQDIHDFGEPIRVQATFGGELINWLVYESKFDNKSGTWKVS